MAEQHRATAIEWACIEALVDDNVTYSCILELHDRIEALEAPQSGSIDLSHLSDDEREKMARWIANPDKFEVLEVAQPAKSNQPENSDSSLKERIKSRLIQSVGSTWEVTTASVLTEIADWFEEQGGAIALGWAMRLEQGAKQ